MSLVYFPTDCGHAPKKLFLKEWYLALAQENEAFLQHQLMDNATWQLAGSVAVFDHQHWQQALLSHHIGRLQTMHIEKMITHGPTAAVSGQLLTQDNRRYLFCDLYSFKSASSNLIQAVTSFRTEQV